MKRILAAALAFAAFATPAFATGVEALFGNTLVVQPQNGPQFLLHFNADNTYVMTFPDNTTVNGVWAVQSNQMCLTPQGGQQECHPAIGERAVGETWTAPGAEGSVVTMTVRRGR